MLQHQEGRQYFLTYCFLYNYNKRYHYLNINYKINNYNYMSVATISSAIKILKNTLQKILKLDHQQNYANYITL